MDDRGIARAPQHEIDRGRFVDCRARVRLRDDGRDAARGSSLARRCERLAILGTWFADERAHVDQSGGGDLVAAVHDLGAFGYARSANAALGITDDAIGDQEIANEIDIA